MRITVVSRIYAPEPAAASFRLEALARALAGEGDEVSVVTTTLPPQLREARKHIGGALAADPQGEVRVRRWPVLRDKAGYVRGYLQYLSFDVPAFFRILFGKRADVIVVEPPPTTGFAMRIACALRRTPYVYYAADVWSDASAATGAPAFVVRALRGVERWVWRGAAAIVSVSPGVTTRLRELDGRANVVEVGNGVDTSTFAVDGARKTLDRPYFLYAGTASEWHGASIFVDALREVLVSEPDACIVFLGQGAEIAQIVQSAADLPDGSVRVLPRAPGSEAAEWLRGSVAALASVRPGRGYDFAFPTKAYAAAACGVPVVYAGPKPAGTIVSDAGIGQAVPYQVDATATAMLDALEAARSDPELVAQRGRARATWIREHASLAAVAARAAAVVRRVGQVGRGTRGAGE